jgi:phosphoglycolate phosphatase
VRCLYLDLDATLLGRGGALLLDGEGDVSLLGTRAIEACLRADVEVVLMSGRRQESVAVPARMFGQASYIFEVGSCLVLDGEEHWLTGDLLPGEQGTIHEQIAASGAPAMLLERYAGRLEFHAPWHLDREVSHLFRGLVDPREADELLAAEGHSGLRLVDNGEISRGETSLDLRGQPHAYHLIPAAASKAGAVARHMRARGYARDECIGVGDSREDLEVAQVVGRLFLVSNAAAGDTSAYPNVERTEAAMSEGFYEAVIRALAEAREGIV